MFLRRNGFYHILLISLILAPCMVAETFSDHSIPDPNDGLFYIAPLINARIDGVLDEWQTQRPVHLNRPNQVKYRKQDWGGPDDCSTKFWWGWNQTGILVAAETIDDSLSFPFTGRDVWANDCIQFAIDVRDDNSHDTYQNDDREFVVTLIDSQPRVYEFSYSEHRSAGIRAYPCQIEIKNDTIRYEALIPWDELGITGSMAGKHIGASLVAFDNDGDDFRGYLEWTMGIAGKKFTLPFANLLFFHPKMKMVQTITTQPFLAESDSLILWTYTGYWRQKISYQLLDGEETLFRNSVTIRGDKWKKLIINPKYLKWGQLKLEITSPQISQQYDIAIWSQKHITEQLSYLAQQSEVLKNLTGVDPTAHILVKYWVDWLQNQFSSANTNFEFYNVMYQAQKRIDLIPNLYMNQLVFYNREYRIVEKMFYSKLEKQTKRYLAYLPLNFQPENSYPLLIYLYNKQENVDESAHKMCEILSRIDAPVIGLFPHCYPYLGLSQLTPGNIMEQFSEISEKYRINPDKIYLIGEGMGGIEALVLAQHFPDRFAAATLVNSKIDSTIDVANLKYTPLWIVSEDKYHRSYSAFSNKIKSVGGKIQLIFGAEKENVTPNQIYTSEYFDWLLKQTTDPKPLKIDLKIQRMQPATAFWIKILAQENYDSPSSIDAVVDSNKLFVVAKKLSAFSILLNKLPTTATFPLQVTINYETKFVLSKNETEVTFQKFENGWRIRSEIVEELEKTFSSSGPMSAIFNRPTVYVYSTGHPDSGFNNKTYQLAKRASQRDYNTFLNHLVIADTVVTKQSVESNMIIFGNDHANAYLKKISAKLPIQITENEILKFGKSLYFGIGSAAFYIYPNPLNPNFSILIGISPDLEGLKNIADAWNLSDDNHLFDFDYVIIDNDFRDNNILTAVDNGHFDNNWQGPWFQSKFKKGPQRWFTDYLVGFDANQLSFNSNWKGGGKGSFTWKIYSKTGLKYKWKKYDFQNTLYCAFGQISVQEKENWRAPEKSNDIIDFNSVLRLTLEQFIDPYIAFSLNTQFQDGFDPKTKQLVSRFLNPLNLSQSAGVVKNLIKKNKITLTTRLGYGAKEAIASQKKFRSRWTGDLTKWMKIDGGVEWFTELESNFNKKIQWTNKLKFFQAVFSSIRKEKDPNQNWQKLDIYWEQMFTAQLTKYVLFNVVMKFLYDRDISGGGQFLENASLGVSYRFN